MVLIADSKPLKSKETKKITKQVIKCKADGKVAKDYSYRSTWKHDFSRAYNKAKRGGLTKEEMLKKHGRFPKKKEWWGSEKNEKEWEDKWILEHRKY